MTGTISPNPSTSVAVVGSANLDLVIRAKHAPEPGQTVLGDGISEHPGGKGLNQAVAAGRVTRTAFVGALGSDSAGAALREALSSDDVDTSFVRTVDGASGLAVIHLADDGENSITVISGANDAVTADDTVAALDALQPAVVVTQLETPLESVVAAARWAQRHSARWVFNPSPLDRLLDAAAEHPIHQLWATADPIIVNAGEARAILGSPATLTTTEAVATELADRVTSVVVTDGARGAYVGHRGDVSFVAAASVDAVDTTGAGDSFAGTLAARLALGDDLIQAASTANTVAGKIVTLARSDR